MNRSLPRLPVERASELVCYLLVVAPMCIQALQVFDGGIRADWGDGFRYVWNIDVSIHFLANSAQTTRIIFYMLGNDPQSIVAFNYVLSGVAAVFIFRALQSRHALVSLLVAFLLGLAWSSAHLNWYARYLGSESLTTSLFIISTISLFANRSNIAWGWRVAPSIMFCFVRNIAPYVVLCQVALYLVVFFRDLRHIRVWAPLVVLTIAALTSLYNIQRFDTTREINVADNLYAWIFPHEDKVSLFNKKYGMPTGPFIDVCNKSRVDINSLCVDHTWGGTGDEFTRQYRVMTDDYGFADWIRTKGVSSWQHYILFENAPETLKQYAQGYARWSNDFGENFQQWWNPTTSLHIAFKLLGALNLYLVAIYLFVGALIYSFVYQERILRLGLVFILCGLGGTFIALFGDPVWPHRYTHPPMVWTYIGLLFYFLGIMKVAQKTISKARILRR